jgi:hypothetical protein
MGKAPTCSAKDEMAISILLKLLNLFTSTVEDQAYTFWTIGDKKCHWMWLRGADDHDHTQYSVIKAQHRSEKDIQAPPGTVTQFRQEFPVVFEIDQEQDRDAEDKLAVRHWIENVVGDIFPELNH